MSYCTFSNNIVGDRSLGAISVGGAELDMDHCTISGNMAELIGGIQVGDNAIVKMRNSILDNNLTTQNAQFSTSNLSVIGNGVFVSEGHNLTGDALASLNHPTDITLTPPLLAPLTNSSSGSPTRIPLFGSPAIDTGAGDGFAIDGRGFPGKQGPAVDIGAVETGLPVVVTTAVDEFDTPSGSAISLREALRDARETSQIVFSSATILSGAVIDLRTANQGQGAPLESSKNLVIDATMIENGVTIQGAGSGLRCLTLPNGIQTFSLHGVSFKNGSAATNGSAIYKGLNTELTITHSAISGCFSSNNAAAIHANGGFLTLENVTVANNGSSKGGSAISGRNGAEINLRHSTLFNNSITTTNFPGGAAIFLETNASLYCNHVALGDNFNTVTFAPRSLLRFGSTPAVGDIYFTHADDSTIPGATQHAALSLHPLQQAGGLASTCPPDSGSPIVDVGYSIFTGNPSTDARGFARKYGPAMDIGAYELGSFLPGTTDPPIDVDNDGMDYYWELYYGLIPSLQDGDSDTDNDGLSALGEYLSQTNPNVANVIVPLEIINFDYNPTNGRVSITLSTSEGIAYSLWYSADLSDGSFSPIQNLFGAPGGNSTQLLIEASTYGGGAQGFFRAQKP